MSTPDVTPAAETEDILPRKWRRSDRRLRRLNTELLEAIENHEVEEVERYDSLAQEEEYFYS